AVVIDPAILEMRRALLGARQFHAMCAADGPAAHHHVRDFRVELDAEGVVAVTESLARKCVALGQASRTRRQLETLAMPLIDMIGPDRRHRAALLGRADRIIADLDL